MSAATRRRWLWPVIVLLVGGAMSFWFAQRETHRMASIERQVREICLAVADNRDLTGTLNRDNRSVESKIIQTLHKTINSRETASVITVKVKPGDNEQAGASALRATHTATIMVGGEELLGLRVQCTDPDEPITVLGYWVPQAN